MGGTERQVHGKLEISVAPGTEHALDEMLREAAAHGARLEVSGLTLVFPGDAAMQLLWERFMAESGVRFELHLDPILGELDAQDRQVIEEFTSVRSGDRYLNVRCDVRRLQRLVQAVYGRNLPAEASDTLVPQTSLALRKLSFMKDGFFREQLWHERWGLNLTLLYELLSAPDNSGIMSAITRISDMGVLRAQYLRDFVIACKQRGVV